MPHGTFDGDGMGATVLPHGVGLAGGSTQMPGQSVSGPQLEPSRATQS